MFGGVGYIFGGQSCVSLMSSPAADNSDTDSNPRELPCNPARRQTIWPEVVIGLGFGLTAGWMILLGYGVVLVGSGVVRLVEHTI